MQIIKVEREVKSLVAKDEHGLVIVHKLSHLQVFCYRMDAYVYAVIEGLQIRLELSVFDVSLELKKGKMTKLSNNF